MVPSGSSSSSPPDTCHNLTNEDDYVWVELLQVVEEEEVFHNSNWRFDAWKLNDYYTLIKTFAHFSIRSKKLRSSNNSYKKNFAQKVFAHSWLRSSNNSHIQDVVYPITCSANLVQVRIGDFRYSSCPDNPFWQRLVTVGLDNIPLQKYGQVII